MAITTSPTPTVRKVLTAQTYDNKDTTLLTVVTRQGRYTVRLTDGVLPKASFSRPMNAEDGNKGLRDATTAEEGLQHGLYTVLVIERHKGVQPRRKHAYQGTAYTVCPYVVCPCVQTLYKAYSIKCTYHSDTGPL